QSEFRAIISDIMLTPSRSASDGTRGRTLGVIGVSSGVGSSTVSAAMAMVATEKCGLESTLIDANSENSSLSKFFNLNGAPGLAELANGDATHDECMQKRSESGLSLISSSSAYKERQRFDASPKSISAAIYNFQLSSDLVIVDLPPAVSADRAVALTHYMDFVLLVVESEKTELAAAQRIVRRLSQSDRQVVGVILNKTQSYLPNWLGNLIGLS
ncbi:MAG: P-loop NTPase, partial [Planctomycetales bacterium]|nr:P-loop NTPase [Planctomycetales bacterium]